jgi:AcrR family transcriptional regulator
MDGNGDSVGRRPTSANESRERILGAAVDVFRGNRAETVSIDDIAREAKVAKKTIYLHFASYTELRRTAFQRALEEVIARGIEKAMAPDVHDVLRAAIDFISALVVETPMLVRFLMSGIAEADADAERARASAIDAISGVWVDTHSTDYRAGRTLRPIDRAEVIDWLGMLTGSISYSLEIEDHEKRRTVLGGFLNAYRRAHPFA